MGNCNVIHLENEIYKLMKLDKQYKMIYSKISKIVKDGEKKGRKKVQKKKTEKKRVIGHERFYAHCTH